MFISLEFNSIKNESNKPNFLYGKSYVMLILFRLLVTLIFIIVIKQRIYLLIWIYKYVKKLCSFNFIVITGNVLIIIKQRIWIQYIY